jgi:hypothetical protein
MSQYHGDAQLAGPCAKGGPYGQLRQAPGHGVVDKAG